MCRIDLFGKRAGEETCFRQLEHHTDVAQGYTAFRSPQHWHPRWSVLGKPFQAFGSLFLDTLKVHTPPYATTSQRCRNGERWAAPILGWADRQAHLARMGYRVSWKKYNPYTYTVHTYIYIYTYIHTLHYITLHYITLHYITIHYITLHYITYHTYHNSYIARKVGV